MSTLTLLTTAHIQSYIFAHTNRLRESVGASWLVQNVFSEFKEKPEEVFIGGGQAALRFRGNNSEERAKQALQAWSLKMLREAPGLRVVAVHIAYEEGQLQKAFLDARKRHLLEVAENALPHGSPMGALPIARTCPSTGLAANCFYKPSKQEEGQWINVEAATKRDAAAQSRKEDKLAQKYDFPTDLEELGLRKGDSMIALIHADGDGVGQELGSTVERSYSDDEAFIAGLKKFSLALTELTDKALEQLCSDLAEVLDDLQRRKLIEHKKFPLRPVIGAGDDVTFICPASLGLSLAAHYIKLFTKFSGKATTDYGSTRSELTASAGVLLMPQKFPFARGYALVSDLTKNAKRERRGFNSGTPWIDFHLLHEGVTGNLETLRQHYNVEGNKNLLARPYSLEDFEGKFHKYWNRFYEDWPRSSAKSLLEALARGEDFSRARLAYFRSRGRQLPPDVPETGWRANKTELFDPLEFLDHYVPIDWKSHRVILPARANNRPASKQNHEGSYAYV